MAEEKKPALIADAIKAKYKMAKGFNPGVYHFKGFRIDTSNCSLEDIDAAVKLGFDVVELIKEPEPAKTAEAKK